MTFLAVFARTLLGVVFVLALAGKLRSRRSFGRFAASLHEIGWLPKPVRAASPFAVVAVEGISVLLLAVPATVPAGFALAFLTLAAFTASVGWSLRQGQTVRCQCFGTDSGPMGASQVTRNCVLLAVAAAGLLASAAGRSSASAAPVGLAVAVAVAGGAVSAVLVVRWDDLRFVFSPSTAGR
jgi:Methylamine utilisation protein MauE